MNNKEIVTILRCDGDGECAYCPALKACHDEYANNARRFENIIADRLERMEKQLARLKREKGALIRYCARMWPCDLCMHRHFEEERCPLHNPGKNGRCVNWTYDGEFADREGTGNEHAKED